MTDKTKPESMSGSCIGYRVEARSTFPRVLGGKHIVTSEWAPVPMEYAPVGVKPHHDFDTGIAMFHVCNYAAAQALRWWLLSELPPFSIETRIARFKIKYSGEKHEDGYCEEIDMAGRRVEGEKT